MSSESNETSENNGQLSIEHNYEQLFKDQPFDIIASSSISGQFSIYDTYIGGYFTMAIETAMFNICHREPNSKNVTWQNIFSRASQITSAKASQINDVQTPQFEINFQQSNEYYNENDTIIHIVQPDEGLWRISQTYEVSLNDLRKWNNKENTDLVLPGEKLIILKHKFIKNE